MESSPLNSLPQETLHQIFIHLPLRQIAAVKSTCRSLYSSLSSPSFLHLLRTQSNPLTLLALKPSSPHPTLHAFDPQSDQRLTFSLSFLPYSALHPITSSHGLLYLWASAQIAPLPLNTQNTLLVCNPLTGKFKVLPQLGLAWPSRASVLAGWDKVVVFVTEPDVMYYLEGNSWLRFSSNLPSKPRSPVLVSDCVVALCDVGSPWRSQWAMFCANVVNLERWERVEKREWGDVFDILDWPRLVKGGDDGEKKVYMVGGLKSSSALRSACSTVLILRLDLESLEWEEAGRMPVEMYRCFVECSKFKVFGGGDKVCFSGRIGRLALWEDFGEGKAEWRWVEGVSGSGDGVCRGFAFEARLDAEV